MTPEYDVVADASYAHLAPGNVARTIEVSDSVMVDVDIDGRPLGVEVLGEGDWRDGLAALAMAGRLVVLPPDGSKPEMSDDEFVRRLRLWALRNPAEYREEMYRLAMRESLRSRRSLPW